MLTYFFSELIGVNRRAREFRIPNKLFGSNEMKKAPAFWPGLGHNATAD